MARSLVYSVLVSFLACSDPVSPTITYDNGNKHETYSTSDGVATWDIERNPGGRVIRQRVTFSDPRDSKPCKNYIIVRDSGPDGRANSLASSVNFRLESLTPGCDLGDLENRFWTTVRLANKYHGKPVSRN